MIVVTKDSQHKSVDLAFVRGLSGIAFGFVYAHLSKEPIYVKEGYAMEKFLLRGLFGALTFLMQIYANKQLNSSIFAVMSRMKVFFTLIISSLFSGDTINAPLLMLTILCFIGVCLVMDPSIFGLDSKADPHSIRIIGLKREILGILSCVVYMLLSAISRSVMVFATIEMNTAQAFVFLSIFNIINSAFVFIYDPIVWRVSELHTYIKISIIGIVFIYAFCMFLTYESDLAIFILIQTTIVFFTFLIDVFYYGTKYNSYNILGGLIVIGSAFATLLLR